MAKRDIGHKRPDDEAKEANGSPRLDEFIEGSGGYKFRVGPKTIAAIIGGALTALLAFMRAKGWI